MSRYSILFFAIVVLYYCGIKPVQSGCADKKPWCGRRKIWCTGKFKLWMQINCCKTCGGHPAPGQFAFVACEKADPCVDDMNKYRRLHEGTGDVRCDKQLTIDAQKWADTLAKEHAFRHASGTGEGENIYSSSVWPKRALFRVPTCKSANRAWYNEIKRWDENTSDRKAVYKAKIAAAKSEAAKHMLGHKYAVGHFTAMVWKATTRVGFGFATYDHGDWRSTIVVARFLPMGNYIPMGPGGPYSKNVGKLKSHDGKRDEIFTEIVEMLDDEDDEAMLGRPKKKDDVKEEVMDTPNTKEQKDDLTEQVMSIVSDVLGAK